MSPAAVAHLLGIARLVVDPFSYWINTSAPEEVAAFDALIRQGLSPLEAVCRLAGVDPATLFGAAHPRLPAIGG